MTRQSSPLPPPISRAQAQFANWRSTRATRRIPASLWRLATELASRFGLSLTARVLRLDYQGLKVRLEASRSGGGEKASVGRHQLSFVEIPPLTAAPTSPECLIEIENASGAKMRIQVKGMSDLNLSDLTRSFTESVK